MSRFGILSKHIVITSDNLSDPRYPVAGLIIISDEIIEEVISLDPDVSYKKLQSEFSDLEIIDCSDLYISPGLIDLNVRREWEDLELLSKAAAEGGVSVIALEAGHYASPVSSTTSYCDIARVTAINDFTDFSGLPPNTCALKCYLFPPSHQVKSVANLQHVMGQAFRTGLPLFMDATLPDPRMLYMASPLRLEAVEERKDSTTSTTGVFASAYSEKVNDSGDDSQGSQCKSEESEDELPVRSSSLQSPDVKLAQFLRSGLICEGESPRNKEFEVDDAIEEAKESDEYSPLKTPPMQKEPGESTPLKVFIIRKETKEAEESVLGRKSPKKKGSIHDIYNDLDERIKASQNNVKDLCIAEKSTYAMSGPTSFQFLQGPPKPSSLSIPSPIEKSTESESSEPGSASLPTSLSNKRLMFRPAPIVIKQETRPDTLKDYKHHLANYPEHWEISGVEKVLEFLAPTNRVHFQNLSSAGSLNRIRQIKQKFKKVTCEVPAVHLHFTSASVQDGDTRFKNTPPERKPGNCTLLWDLLKMKGIDVVASQHAAIQAGLKITNNFQQALNGISSIGCSLQSVWSVLNIPVATSEQLEHYIVRLAKWMSMHPARALGIEAMRGSITKGKYADFMIWNPWEKFRVGEDYQYALTSPFEGEELLGAIKKVYLRGKLVHSGYPTGKEITPVEITNT